MIANADNDLRKVSPTAHDDVECLILQPHMWRPGELRLIDRETSAMWQVPSLTLDVTTATEQQRQVALEVLKDKYGLDARIADSSSLQNAPVIRVADRTTSRDAARLNVLLHMADPANWRKSLGDSWVGGQKIPIVSYRVRNVQESVIAAAFLNKLDVEYRSIVIIKPETINCLQITGISQVQQLMRKLPMLHRNMAAIPGENPTSETFDEPEQPQKANRASTPPPKVDPAYARERIKPDDGLEPGRPHERAKPMGERMQETKTERPLSAEERFFESERKKVLRARQANGRNPNYSPDDRLETPDRWELQRLAAANPDGSEDLGIRAERLRKERHSQEFLKTMQARWNNRDRDRGMEMEM